MLSRILIVFAVVVLLLIGTTFFLPTSWEVANAIEIDAPRAEIHSTVSDLKTWREWTVWSDEADPDCKWSFEGAESGEGAIMRWDGPELGKGSLTIESSDPAEGIDYVVDIEGMGPIHGNIDYIESADAVEVRWTDLGEASGMLDRWMALILQPMLQSEFRKNLEQLKARTEAD